MIGKRAVFLSGSRAHILLVATVAFAIAASLAFGSAAWATAPSGDFAEFSQCPRFTAGVEICLYTRIVSGEVKVDRQIVPVANPMRLQGGITNAGTDEEKFVGALDGETLSNAPQNVPGGLSGLIECDEIGSLFVRRVCETVFAGDVGAVTATTELARPAGDITISTNNLVNQEGVALSLPVRIHLINPLLGRECFVGSSANPMTLDLTSGTTSPPAPSRPIRGVVGELGFKDEFELANILGNVLVDNAFPAPAATGCGGSYAPILDPIIDRKIGLPAPAGHNTAILRSDTQEGATVGVTASEK